MKLVFGVRGPEVICSRIAPGNLKLICDIHTTYFCETDIFDIHIGKILIQASKGWLASSVLNWSHQCRLGDEFTIS